MKVDAVILARIGSKGIPRKNLKNFCGKPLVEWSIIQAKKSRRIRNIFLSSDSNKILKIGKKHKINTIKRPKKLSGDKASSESGIIHIIKNFKNISKSGLIYLEPSSPLRKKNDIDNLIKDFFKYKWDSGFTAGILKDFLIWEKISKNKFKAINYNFKNRGQRFGRKECYVENSLAYIFKPKKLLKFKNRLSGKIGISVNEIWQSFELDEKEDWKFVSSIFKNYLLKKGMLNG